MGFFRRLIVGIFASFTAIPVWGGKPATRYEFSGDSIEVDAEHEIMTPAEQAQELSWFASELASIGRTDLVAQWGLREHIKKGTFIGPRLESGSKVGLKRAPRTPGVVILNEISPSIDIMG